MSVGKLFIVMGLALACLGLLWLLAERIGLGRLPGDIVLKGDKYTVYIPVVTCLLLSVVLSLALWLARLWRG
jgi:hypothetical protein